jgi:hypothetical protein
VLADMPCTLKLSTLFFLSLSGSCGASSVPNVAKKLAELEVALVHCQQNMDIPQVILPIDPLIKKAVLTAQQLGMFCFVYINDFRKCI